jgi:trehalose 6-phosphate phosphatase
VLERLREAAARTGLFLDFDGTLSDIVPRPELAKPVPGAASVLSRLASRYALVAVVSGRPGAEMRRLLPVRGVQVFGLYGLPEGIPPSSVVGAWDDVEAAAGGVPGAWVENKVSSLAVHYRAAQDVDAAGRELSEALRSIADRLGLTVMPGKMVVELVPPDTPGKGSVILAERAARDLRACLYAGDDLADLHAFAALDQLRGEGIPTVKVAVRSAETPDELLSEADIVVERPAGLVELLSGL